jgi:cytochrome b-561
MERAEDLKIRGVGNNDNLKMSSFTHLYLSAQVFSVISVVLVITWVQTNGGLNWNSSFEHLFNWHPFLMVFSFVFLYGNAMMIFRLMRNEPKLRLKLIHTTLNGLAFIVAVMGIIATVTVHDDHMHSLHSWIGAGTMGLFGINLIGGITFFLFPQVPAGVRTVFLPFHVYGGQAALILIGFSIVSGTMEAQDDHRSGGKYPELPEYSLCLLNFLGITVIVFILISMFAVSRGEYQRKPLPSEVTPVITTESSTTSP